MKNFILTALTVLVSLTTQAQQPGKHVYIPGRGHLDVEQFIKPIDTRMDISRLSLAELRILRNAFAARQGFVLKDADLRHIFSQTSWYDSLVWVNFDLPEEQMTDPSTNDWEFFSGYSEYAQSVKLTPQERKFIKRICDRENNLRWQGAQNLPERWRFPTDNILNPFQLEKMDSKLVEALGRNSFAIVPGRKIQLFHVYEKNDYSDFPSFVTTDLYLQAFHQYFDVLLRKVEETKFTPRLISLCDEMHTALSRYCYTEKDPKLVKAAEHAAAYFAIGHALLTGSQSLNVPVDLLPQVSQELKQINAFDDSFSDFLDYHEAYFMYSLFRPRGHYSRTEPLQRYFKAMTQMYGNRRQRRPPPENNICWGR